MVMTGEQIQYAVIAIVFIAMVIIVVRNLKKVKKRTQVVLHAHIAVDA